MCTGRKTTFLNLVAEDSVHVCRNLRFVNLELKAVCSKKRLRRGESLEVPHFLGVVSLQLAYLGVLKQRECSFLLLAELGSSQGRR